MLSKEVILPDGGPEGATKGFEDVTKGTEVCIRAWSDTKDTDEGFEYTEESWEPFDITLLSKEVTWPDGGPDGGPAGDTKGFQEDDTKGISASSESDIDVH